MNIWRSPYPKFGSGPGLARVAAIARALGLDLAGFGGDGAAIIGSNGKGSTAAMCAALLQHVSAPVGLFTSPHLLRLNERLRIDGEDIDDGELGVHWARVQDAVRTLGFAHDIGGFEFLFLIAADWFAARGCAHTIWEAGIGGRLDPVRLIEARRLALTSLDLEHTELLGATLSQIACDKAGAAPRGAAMFVGEIDEEAMRALAAHCTANDVSLVSAALPEGFDAPLAGAHQRNNAALALALARDIRPLSDADIRAGLAATRWPGRLEIIETEPLTIIDVGHTPRAIAAALAGFAAIRGEREAVLVCGASRDKDFGAIVAALAPAFATIVCTAAAHKGAPVAEVTALAERANPSAEIIAADNVADARRAARQKARARCGAIYVAGGLFLAAEYRAAACGLDPALLAFF